MAMQPSSVYTGWQVALWLSYNWLAKNVSVAAKGRYSTFLKGVRKGGFCGILSERSLTHSVRGLLFFLKLYKNKSTIYSQGIPMEILQQRIEQAMTEKDFSTAIKLMDDLASISRINIQRQALQSLRKNTLQERKEFSEYCFVTVNPAPTITFEEFQYKVNKMATKVWMKEYIYVYEQRGTSMLDIGKGFHLHLIFKKPLGKPGSHCVREIAKTFEKCCDTSNYHLFNTKWIGQEEYIRKREYILGKKESTSENQKDLKQAMDIEWRKLRNIRPFYNLGLEVGQQ